MARITYYPSSAIRRVDTVRSKKSTVRKDVRSVFLPEDEVSCGGQDNSNKEEEEEEEEEDDDCPKELLSTMHITDDDDDDDELDDGAGDEHLHERGIIDGVVEEKDFQVKESKLYSSKGVRLILVLIHNVLIKFSKRFKY